MCWYTSIDLNSNLYRGPDSTALGLDAVSVETDVESGKVIVDERDETMVHVTSFALETQMMYVCVWC